MIHCQIFFTHTLKTYFCRGAYNIVKINTKQGARVPSLSSCLWRRAMQSVQTWGSACAVLCRDLPWHEAMRRAVRLFAVSWGNAPCYKSMCCICREAQVPWVKVPMCRVVSQSAVFWANMPWPVWCHESVEKTLIYNERKKKNISNFAFFKDLSNMILGYSVTICFIYICVEIVIYNIIFL